MILNDCYYLERRNSMYSIETHSLAAISGCVIEYAESEFHTFEFIICKFMCVHIVNKIY